MDFSQDLCFTGKPLIWACFFPGGKKKSELVAFFLKGKRGFDKSWQSDDYRHKHNGTCWSEVEGRQICTKEEAEVKKDDTSWSDWVYGRQCFSWSLLGKTLDTFLRDDVMQATFSTKCWNCWVSCFPVHVILEVVLAQMTPSGSRCVSCSNIKRH